MSSNNTPVATQTQITKAIRAKLNMKAWNSRRSQLDHTFALDELQRAQVYNGDNALPYGVRLAAAGIVWAYETGRTIAELDLHIRKMNSFHMTALVGLVAANCEVQNDVPVWLNKNADKVLAIGVKKTSPNGKTNRAPIDSPPESGNIVGNSPTKFTKESTFRIAHLSYSVWVERNGREMFVIRANATGAVRKFQTRIARHQFVVALREKVSKKYGWPTTLLIPANVPSSLCSTDECQRDPVAEGLCDWCINDVLWQDYADYCADAIGLMYSI